MQRYIIIHGGNVWPIILTHPVAFIRWRRQTDDRGRQQGQVEQDGREVHVVNLKQVFFPKNPFTLYPMYPSYS
jgi:hypothetical protein